MLFTKLVLFCSLLVVMCVVSAPVDEDNDMKVTDVQLRDFKTESRANSRMYTLPPKYKWPTNKIPYSINEADYSKDDLAVFHQALADIENKTCIRFVKRVAQKDFIQVRDDGSGTCVSHLGRVGGKQFLNLSPGCMQVRKKCAHEMIHALGFRHMHQRYDRDTALTIKYANIEEKDKQWFDKYDNQWEAYNTPYDVYSCMHYTKYAFSKNGKDTIVTKNAARINRMYKCLTP